jgi:hypothetical protein
MTEPLSADAPEYLAARLALLALRASVGKDIPLEPDRVALNGAPATSVDAAAHMLALLPKPTLCSGDVEAGVLSVRCLALDDADPDAQRSFHFHRKDDAEQGGFMGWLEDRYGPGDHAVVIFGRGERLEVTLSVVELWHAHYEIQDVSYRGDDVENPLCDDEPEYREARSLGARALLSFSSPADSRGSGVTFTLPLSESATTEEREQVEKILVDMAESYHMFLTLDVDDMLPAPAETESQFRRWQRRSLREHREHMKQLAPDMERFFAGREMPPEVAAFIAACREPS